MPTTVRQTANSTRCRYGSCGYYRVVHIFASRWVHASLHGWLRKWVPGQIISAQTTIPGPGGRAMLDPVCRAGVLVLDDAKGISYCGTLPRHVEWTTALNRCTHEEHMVADEEVQYGLRPPESIQPPMCYETGFDLCWVYFARSVTLFREHVDTIVGKTSVYSESHHPGYDNQMQFQCYLLRCRHVPSHIPQDTYRSCCMHQHPSWRHELLPKSLQSLACL